ncbi:MAG: GAF domain-containing protein [Caulobacteraceae bacterium]
MSDPHDIRAPASAKARLYADLEAEIASVLRDEPDGGARMATVAAMLAAGFERFSWTGFYLVDRGKPDELVIGPYQGTLGCLRIPFGRGVCGAAASSGKTVIVADVDAFADHIACDSRSRSEIVVPVFDGVGELIAVLDVDSVRPGAFDAIDAAGLEAIVRRVFANPP